MAEEYWAAAGHAERFDVGPEATREMAIEAMHESYVPGDHFRTGRRQDIDIRDLCPDADVFLEAVCRHLGDMVGEASEDWCPTGVQEMDLSVRLQQLFGEWIERHKLQPTFFEVVDIQEHTVS